ncbi:MAG: hypothetical protein AAFU53_03290 [Cyanobacteria bacterium J06632_3]
MNLIARRLGIGLGLSVAAWMGSTNFGANFSADAMPLQGERFGEKGEGVEIAQTSYYYAGTANTGTQVLVDLGSIEPISTVSASFSYLRGNDQILAQANCTENRTWITLDDGTLHTPRSRAAQNMLRVVCSYLEQAPAGAPEQTPARIASNRVQSNRLLSNRILSNRTSYNALPTPIEPPTPRPRQQRAQAQSPVLTALVYDPSSNVRATPNGQIICSIDTVTYINIFGRVGDWYDTDACGRLGMIHSSQISFD